MEKAAALRGETRVKSACTAPLISLGPRLRLRFQGEACLALRSRYSNCARCRDACPAGVLAINKDGVTLAEGCLDCGQCAAACPSGALQTPPLDLSSLAALASGAVSADCWKVPAHCSPKNALRVPCLGGLSADDILQIVAQGDGRQLVLLDRGWCAACQAGGGRHPTASALETVRQQLAAVGVAMDKLPCFKQHPLTVALMPAEIPESASERRLSRRGFLRALVGSADMASTPWAATAAAPVNAGREPMVLTAQRRAGLTYLRTLAERQGLPSPGLLFPRVMLSAACRSHHLCAALCPTGALRLRLDGDQSSLEFSAESCIACGDCERACPEHAITVERQADGAAPPGVRTLKSTALRECHDCGERFSANNEDEELCPSCCKSHRLVRSVFEQFVSR